MSNYYSEKKTEDRHTSTYKYLSGHNVHVKKHHFNFCLSKIIFGQWWLDETHENSNGWEVIWMSDLSEIVL